MNTTAASLAAVPIPRGHGARVWFRRLGPLAVAGVGIIDFIRLQSFAGPKLGFQLVPMAPGTAAVLVLLALALGLDTFGASRRLSGRLVRAVCLVVIGLSAFSLLGQLQGTVAAWESWLPGTAPAATNYGVSQMSYQAAVLAILSACSASALLSPSLSRQGMRDAGIVVTLAVVIFAMAGGISYAAGNPPAALDGWVKIAPVALLGFLVFNALLLLRPNATNRLRQWFFGADISGDEDLPIPRDERVVLALLGCAGVLALGGSVVYVRVQTARLQGQVIEAVQTMSDLKVRTVSQWRRERLGDARSLAKMPFLADAISPLNGSVAGDAQRARLEAWLQVLCANYGHAHIVIFGGEKTPIASYPPRVDLSDVKVLEALDSVKPDTDVVELAPYTDQAGVLRWDLLVPLQINPGTLAGVLWLQALPERPIMSSLAWWPNNFRTGQSVLWLRQNDSLVALGGPRPELNRASGPVPSYGTERKISELPVYSLLGRVLRGETSTGEGLDHSGIPIVGFGDDIRDSNWILTSRVNSSEVYRNLRQDAWIVAGLVIGLLGTTTTATGWLWRQRQKNLVNERIAAEFEQKQLADAELRASEERYRLIADNTSDVIWLYDLVADAFSYVSPAVRSLRGFEPAEIVGQKLMHGVVSAAKPAMERLQAEVLGASSIRRHTVVETELLRKDGSVVPVEIMVTVLTDAAGRATRVLGVTRDLTERLRAREGEAAKANLEREKKLSAMKSQFVSVASHEFRSPLATAVGSLELLERHAAKLNEGKRTELLARIKQALSRLTSIMNDVLTLSRTDAGRVKVSRMAMDLGRFVEDVVRQVELGDQQQHTFVFEKTGGPEVVPADSNLLHHVLSNLLGNAVRYAPAGTRVSVRLELGEASVSLTVADEGIGIPEQDRPTIFEPFVRGSNVGTIGGTGLGLNIVKRYTELMGGTIALLPTARGAAFQVVLPTHQEES